MTIEPTGDYEELNQLNDKIRALSEQFIPRVVEESVAGQGGRPNFSFGESSFVPAQSASEGEKLASEANVGQNRFFNHERYIWNQEELQMLRARRTILLEEMNFIISKADHPEGSYEEWKGKVWIEDTTPPTTPRGEARAINKGCAEEVSSCSCKVLKRSRTLSSIRPEEKG